jgi:outer membrane protein assembly factor BamD
MGREQERGQAPRGHALRGLPCIVFCLVVLGCAGGMPSIPDSSDAILARGDQYFERGKYYQAQELFKAFIERFAGHDRSDYAQFMLAESYFHQDEFALAAVEYRILVTNYGYSEYVDEGFFREALCNYRQSPKPALDQTKAHEALSQLEQFVQVYRTSPLVPEAERYIGEIREKLARKALENATFYIDRKLYVSALIYLDKIIENYPGNRYWVEAKYLKAKVLFTRGEREDEAIALLREVIATSGNARMKGDAQALLERLGGP